MPLKFSKRYCFKVQLWYSLLSFQWIEDKERFSTTSENMDSVVTCNNSHVFVFDNVAMVNITNLTFKGCGKAYPNTTAVMKVINSNIYINHCTFIHSKGRIIDTKFCNMTITKSIFRFSNGSALFARHSTTVCVTDSIYEWNNSSQFSIIYINLGKASLKNCTFHNNSTEGNACIMHIRNSKFELIRCKVTSNQAKMNMLLSAKSTVNISENTFNHNFINSTGIVSLSDSMSTVTCSKFLNNAASFRGILRIYQGEIKIYGTLIFQENKVNRGVFYIYKSEMQVISHKGTKILSRLIIQENIARWGVFLIIQSMVQIYQTILIQGNSVVLRTVDFRKSTVKFDGDVYFKNNTGCILIEESQVEFIKSNKFSSNELQNNIAYEYGGAITSIWSTVKFKGTTRFLGNKSWRVGGACYTCNRE